MSHRFSKKRNSIVSRHENGKTIWKIEGILTVQGRPVESENYALIESVFEEAMTMKGFYPYKRTLFSCMCTQLDFINPKSGLFFNEIITNELGRDIIFYGDDTYHGKGPFFGSDQEKFRAFFQEMGLPANFVESLPLKVPSTELIQAFQNYYRKLSLYDHTAICLLNGMVGGGLILAPMYLKGLVTAADIEGLTTLGYQIDDPAYHVYLERFTMIDEYLEATKSLRKVA